MTPIPSTRPRRRHIAILLGLPAFLLGAVSQSPHEVQLHQLHQLEGSNRAVSGFLRRLNVAFQSDTVYVFTIPPMTAARIEGAVNQFARLLRRKGVKADIIALAVHDRKRAAEAYLRRRAFECDYHRVAGREFLDNFVLSAGTLQVPFVTKFVVSSGELVSSYSLLGLTDSATAAWFIADTSGPRAARPAPARRIDSPVEGRPFRPVIVKRTQLLDSDEYPLSGADYMSVSPSGAHLALRDNLTNHIFVFDLQNGRMLNVLYPDSSEETMFVEAPTAVWRWLKQNNVLNSMYFSHGFCDDSTLLIAATLPKVVAEVAGNDTNIGYHNVAVLVKKNIPRNTPVYCARFQPLPDSVCGGYSHSSASIVESGTMVFAPFHKGWPEGSAMLNDSIPAAKNPFLDEFYQADLHQFAVFDSVGNFVGLWGRLGGRSEQLRLGYVAADCLAQTCGDKLYLSDRYSGKVTPTMVLSSAIRLRSSMSPRPSSPSLTGPKSRSATCWKHSSSTSRPELPTSLSPKAAASFCSMNTNGRCCVGCHLPTEAPGNTCCPNVWTARA